MTLSLDENPAHYQIRAYEPGKIQVNEKIFTQSMIIMPTQLIEDWAPQTLSELKSEHLAVIAELKPKILLLGTGEKLIFPPLEMYGELINQGIGVEIMNTRAACHTYNALSAEGRHVIAALIIL